MSPRVLPATLWPSYPSLEPRRVGGAVTATGLAGHKGARPSRGGLTGEPLGVSRRTGWGTRMMAEGVGRRNLSCTGKPRGLREISGRTRGGDQATRLNQSGFHRGTCCPVVSWRDVIPATRAESLDRYPGGFHPQGRPRRQLGGGPGLGLSPDSGKEASPEGEYRNLRGVEPRRKGEGQKDPRGRGLPAGIPEAQPAAPGLMGG